MDRPTDLQSTPNDEWRTPEMAASLEMLYQNRPEKHPDYALRSRLQLPAQVIPAPELEFTD